MLVIVSSFLLAYVQRDLMGFANRMCTAALADLFHHCTVSHRNQFKMEIPTDASFQRE
jgi:hypothetical protein